MKIEHNSTTQRFGGDRKAGTSLLSKPETRLKQWLVPKIPGRVETYHLTMATLLWAGINVAVAFFAAANLSMLWVVSLTIILQYLTDLLDGELGRQRQTGLVKWGFYMDHFLDFIFLCSLMFVGYMIAPPGLEIWSLALMVILAAFMVNSFLAFGATNEFEIYHYGIGPTEIRIGFILINLFIMEQGTGRFDVLLPLAVLTSLAGLIVNTWKIHRKLWQLDLGTGQATTADRIPLSGPPTREGN